MKYSRICRGCGFEAADWLERDEWGEETDICSECQRSYASGARTFVVMVFAILTATVFWYLLLKWIF